MARKVKAEESMITVGVPRTTGWRDSVCVVGVATVFAIGFARPYGPSGHDRYAT